MLATFLFCATNKKKYLCIEMKNILLIEDDPIVAAQLKRRLKTIDSTFILHGPLDSVKDVKKWLMTHDDYDLIFADIRLRDGIVFDAFHAVKPQSLVIFTTAYDEYALEAFRNNGVDYLLKPFSTNDLRHALEKVEITSCVKSTQNLDNLLHNTATYKERFLVCHGDALLPVRVSDILYFRKNGDYVYAHTKDGSEYGLGLSLSELEQILDPKLFFRISRQHIVCMDAVLRIHFAYGSRLLVELDGCEEFVNVSKERATLLRSWLEGESI